MLLIDFEELSGTKVVKRDACIAQALSVCGRLSWQPVKAAACRYSNLIRVITLLIR